MEKRKAGLHKDVSVIFDGVPLNSDGSSADAQAPNGSDVSRDADASNETAAQASVQSAILLEEKPQEPTDNTDSAQTAVKEQPAILQPSKSPDDSDEAENNSFAEKKRGISTDALKEKLEGLLSKIIKPRPGVNMKKQMAMLVMIPFMVIFLGFSLYKNLGGGGKKSRPAKHKTKAKASASAQKELTWEKPEPYPETLRDPMRFVAAKTIVTDDGDTSIVINGLFVSSDMQIALINGRQMRVGDEVMGARIVAITQNGVELLKDGKSWIQKPTNQGN